MLQAMLVFIMLTSTGEVVIKPTGVLEDFESCKGKIVVLNKSEEHTKAINKKLAENGEPTFVGAICAAAKPKGQEVLK